ncbi:hypothetical protein P1J78_09595 [Psychromarinibacter sp. C21-152]|uniref:ABM domain-containing protein n=1 Tax=Psychromarinibacter sediminicola TaxID=3033385 RepID=A0AAE3T8Q9_9RHOB|nr:hypothetical protein [Psychromarinibacter sediminicola]MDF0600983.1 hypothetical protein [Psychromarinibacter sediminicola]
MSIVVTVRIPDVDMDRVREVEKTHAEQIEKMKDALKRHGCISHRRLYREGEILDIDEWESEEGLRAFLEEMGPTIQELAKARGTGKPFDTIWQVY